MDRIEARMEICRGFERLVSAGMVDELLVQPAALAKLTGDHGLVELLERARRRVAELRQGDAAASAFLGGWDEAIKPGAVALPVTVGDRG